MFVKKVKKGLRRDKKIYTISILWNIKKKKEKVLSILRCFVSLLPLHEFCMKLDL